MASTPKYAREHREALRAAKFPNAPREMCPFCLDWFVNEGNHETQCSQRLLGLRVLK